MAEYSTMLMCKVMGYLFYEKSQFSSMEITNKRGNI